MEDGTDDELATHEDNVLARAVLLPADGARARWSTRSPARAASSEAARGCSTPTAPQSYYPPRADLFDFGSAPCMALIGYLGSCDPGDSAQYFAFLNDVDAVAAATPALWRAVHRAPGSCPPICADGDYALSVEVAKEFDANAADQHPIVHQRGRHDGTTTPTGRTGTSASRRFCSASRSRSAGRRRAAPPTSDIAGYGDWSGATGDVTPPDDTISGDSGQRGGAPPDRRRRRAGRRACTSR